MTRHDKQPKRDPLMYARVLAKRNPVDDSVTEVFIYQLTRLFTQSQLTAAMNTLATRSVNPASARQLDLIRRARRLTFMPLSKRGKPL